MTGHVGSRRGWRLVAAAFAVALGVGSLGVEAVVGVEAVGTVPAEQGARAVPVAVRGLVPAAGVAAFELWFCYRHLDANRTSDDGRVHDSLGVANAITLLRGAAFAGVAGFAAVPPSAALAWLPTALYGTGALLDAVDGWFARRFGRTTVLGEKLDMAFDTLGFLVAPVVAVLWGLLPWWYLSLSAARYLFKAGRGLRRYRGRPVYALPPSLVRRPLAGLQMAFITVALTPVLDAGTVRTLAAVVLTPSLAVFLRDYLVVAGYLGRRKDNHEAIHR